MFYFIFRVSGGYFPTPSQDPAKRGNSSDMAAGARRGRRRPRSLVRWVRIGKSLETRRTEAAVLAPPSGRPLFADPAENRTCRIDYAPKLE